MFSLPLLPVIASFMALFLYSAQVLISKYLGSKAHNAGLMIIYLAAATAAIALGGYVSGTQLHSLEGTVALLSIFCGVFLAGFYILWFRALRKEQVSNVSILVTIQTVLTVLFGFIILGEPYSNLNALLIIGVIVGALLTTFEGKSGFRRGLIVAVFAYLSATISWFFLSFAIRQSLGAYSYPLLISRFVAFLVLLVYYVRTEHAFSRKGNWHMVVPVVIVLSIAAGAFSGIGDMGFSFAINSGMLTIVAAITAAVPAVVAIAARFIYKDRLNALQVLGIVIAIGSSVAISLV